MAVPSAADSRQTRVLVAGTPVVRVVVRHGINVSWYVHSDVVNAFT